MYSHIQPGIQPGTASLAEPGTAMYGQVKPFTAGYIVQPGTAIVIFAVLYFLQIKKMEGAWKL